MAPLPLDASATSNPSLVSSRRSAARIRGSSSTTRNEATRGRGAKEAKLAAAVKARDAEDAAREDHELSVDKLVGEVCALYPKDRKRWEIIFPTVVRGGSRNDDPEPEPAP